ncbi:MAG: hypothetical protein WCG42_07115 [Parachlamydiaceae bacterium]
MFRYAMVSTFFIYLLICEGMYAATSTWTANATPIPLTQTTNSSVFNAASSSGNFMVTWQDSSTTKPFYAIYDGTNWTTPQVIPGLSGGDNVDSDVFVSVSSAGLFMVTWKDTSTLHPFYALYDGSSWTTPQAIPGSGSMFGDAFSAVNPAGEFMVTWVIASGAPDYAIYDGSSWTTPGPIPTVEEFGINAYCSADYSGNFMVTGWNITNLPAYTIYDGTTWTPLTDIGESDANSDVFSSFNSLGFMVTWQDATTNKPFYSIYNGSSWTTPQAIPGSNPIVTNVLSSASPSGDFMVTWKDNATSEPFYAIYDGISWTTPQAIPGAGPSDNYAASSVNVAGNFFLTWQDGTTNDPFYAEQNIQNNPLPPVSLKGKQKSTRFWTQTEFYDVLSWGAPVSGVSPASYKIYRDSLTNLIGVVQAGPNLYFEDHNRRNIAYTYYIVSIDVNGNSSSPGMIVVTPK